MTKHHHTTCKTYAPKPPSSQWTTNQTVAFVSQSKYKDDYQTCCGETAKIIAYDSSCYKFCNIEGNQTAVQTCLTNAGVKAKAYNSSSIDDDTSSAPMRAGPMSKCAVGVTLLMLASFAIGTL